MHEIKTIAELRGKLESLGKLICYPDPFPMFNFRVKPEKFWFFDYTYPVEEEFFLIMIEYCKAIGDNSFSFITLSPHPINTYYKYFNFLASAKFTIDDSSEHFKNFVFKHLGEDRESIAQDSNSVAILSNTTSWIVYTNRCDGIGVLATFVNSEANDLLFQQPYFMPLEEATHFLKWTNKSDLEAFRRSWQEQKLLP